MADFCMPSLGADMESGTLVEWLVEPGTLVRHGDVIATVETQKGLFEIEAFEDGILGEPLVQEGEEVPVGTVLAVIDAGEAAEAPPTKTVEEQAKAAEEEAPSEVSQERMLASPAARRRAEELGVDLNAILGTGPDNVIQISDVEQAAQQRGETEGKDEMAVQPSPVDAGAAMRKAIAAAMSISNREIPHYYLESDIDMTTPLEWLEAENARKSIRERILPAALLLKAVALALRDVPQLNSYWVNDQLQMQSGIHIGFALAMRSGGLLTPALHDVDTQPLAELMQTIGDVIERARNGRLRGSEMTDATVTVTNLGDRGVKTVFGVIYPPQVALIGFGRIAERPVADQGKVVVRRCLTATLAGDHRATDGHTGALFLDALNRHLQKPEAL